MPIMSLGVACRVDKYTRNSVREIDFSPAIVLITVVCLAEVLQHCLLVSTFAFFFSLLKMPMTRKLKHVMQVVDQVSLSFSVRFMSSSAGYTPSLF